MSYILHAILSLSIITYYSYIFYISLWFTVSSFLWNMCIDVYNNAIVLVLYTVEY
jgi:hypothetical protein